MRTSDIVKVFRALEPMKTDEYDNNLLLDNYLFENDKFNTGSDTSDHPSEDLAGYLYKTCEDGTFYEWMVSNHFLPIVEDLRRAMSAFLDWMGGRTIDEIGASNTVLVGKASGHRG